MGNPIVEKFDEVVTTVTEMRKSNDARIEELRKGNESRASEQEEKISKMNADLTKFLKQRDDMVREVETMKTRLELAEAVLDRPKGTAGERLDTEYKDQFFKALRNGFTSQEENSKLKAIESKQKEMYKDVTLGANIGGGFALPKEISASVDKLILAQSAIANEVKTLTVGTSDYQELISIFGGNSGWVAETGSRSATGTPNLRSIKPTWGELYSYPQVSEWSLQDIFFDVVNWLTNDVADGMAINISTAVWSGSGTNRPTGMTNTAPVSTADSASPMRAAAAYQFLALTSPPSPLRVNFDSIINLIYTLKPGYRQDAKFAMSSVVQGAVRMLKTTQGVYLWEPSLQVGQPDRLVGYPVFTWEDMGTNVAGQLPVAFGNFKRAYTLVNRRELNITQDNVTNPGFVRFYVRRRYAGIPANNDAVKFMKLA